MKVHSFLFSILFSVFTYSSFAQISLDSLLLQTKQLYNDGQYQKMLDISYKAINKIEKKKPLDSLQLTHFLHQKANALYGLAKLPQAIADYNKAINFSPNSSEGFNLKGMILYDRAFSEYMLVDYITSYQTVKKAEAILSKLAAPNYDYLLSIYADLGGEASYLGYASEGEFYLQKGLRLLSDHQNELVSVDNKQASKQVLFLHKLVGLYNDVQLDTTIEKKLLTYFSDFEQLRKQQSFNAQEERMYAVSLGSIAQFYLVNRDTLGTQYALKQAAYYLKQALKHIDKEQFPDNYLVLKFNEVQYYLHQKRFKKALRLNEKVAAFKASHDHLAPFIYAQKGLIHLNLQNPKAALKAFKKLVIAIHGEKDLLKADYSNFQPSSLLNHSGLLADIGNEIVEQYPKDSLLLKEASHLYQLALIQFNNCFQIGTFNKKLRSFYERAIGGILKMKTRGYGFNGSDHYPLLNTIENIENRLAWQEFIQNRQRTKAVLPDSLQYKEIYLRGELVKARQENNTYLIEELENQLAKYQLFLKKHFPVFSTFNHSQFDIKNLQKKLTAHQAVLRYKIIEKDWYLFFITKETVQLLPIPKGKKLVSQVAHYTQQLRIIQQNNLGGKELFRQLIPIDISNYKNLIIIPDKTLCSLPFETLKTSDNQYLIEKYSISYAAHLVFVHQPISTTINKNGLMVFTPKYTENFSRNRLATRGNAYRIKGAEKEAKLLGQLFPSTIFQDFHATKQNFITNASNAQLLHLSMHATLNHTSPKLSYLLFTEQDNKDAKMYLEELYGLNLKAEMAVLSACSSGSSQQDNQEGLVSMQQAFTYAGVPATLSSLWEVPDRTTQEIIINFYQYLKKGLDKATALQRAKLDYLQNTDDAHLRPPFFWAGFIVSGDISPLYFNPPSKTNAYLWMGLVGIIFILASRFIRMLLINK